MCLCSLVGGQGVVRYAEILKTTVAVARSWIDVLPLLAEKKRDPWRWTRGGKGTARDRWAAGGERAGGLKREEKNREKLVRATTAGRQRREGIFAGRKEESASGVGGRVEVGVWIVDGTRCTALRYAALHLYRNGRLCDEGGEGGVLFFGLRKEAQMDQSEPEQTKGAEQKGSLATQSQRRLLRVCVRTSEQRDV